ncbi:hypothetical protein [Hydrogenispora ethanolica]
MIPQLLEGVRIIKGAEVNITDYQGRLHIPAYLQERQERIAKGDPGR